MGAVGLRELEVATLSMGVAAILGSLGVIGAWLRLAKTIDNFSPNLITFTRILLGCGIVSTVMLIVLTIWADTFLLLGLPAIALLTGGVCFYVGT